MVYLATSGQSTDWGGCGVWVSQDGNTYTRIGNITAPATMGNLAADLPVPPQVLVEGNETTTEPAETAMQNPDTTNVLKVDLSVSRGNLYSVPQVAADTYTTLSYVDGELVSYRDAELTDKDCYDVSYLQRGIYKTTIAEHKAGTDFVKLDDAIFKYSYAEVNIGKTIYIKLTSFNFFGKSEQTLDEVTAYTHILTDTRQVASA